MRKGRKLQLSFETLRNLDQGLVTAAGFSDPETRAFTNCARCDDPYTRAFTNCGYCYSDIPGCPTGTCV
jgi:hypothetical protein